MKFITIAISVFTITTAIRVPNTWHSSTSTNIKDGRIYKQNKPIEQYRTIQSHGGTLLNPQPHIYTNKRPNKVYNKRTNTPYTRAGGPKKNNLQNPLSNVRISSNDWIPIIPLNNNAIYNTYRKPINHNFRKKLSKGPKSIRNKQRFSHSPIASPVYQNYRDDKTHEPSYDQHYVKEEFRNYEREEQEKPPVSDHEQAQEIPTRPEYPGEGKWAKPGTKYKPFTSKQQYTTLEDTEEKPEGYDVFLDAEKLFDSQRTSFGQNLKEFPEKHKLAANIKQSSEEEVENEGENEEGGDHKFVPLQVYTQVRRSENEEHLPADSDEEDRGKLREVIKDSKIQTVYTEEGYEDSAYDHAGHEKNAENDEGASEFEKEIEKEKDKKVPKHLPKIIEPRRYQNSYSNVLSVDDDANLEKYKKDKLSFKDNEEDDSDPAGTEYRAPTKPNNNNKKKMMNKNNFIKTRETKTMAVKDKGNGNMEMEISSEVKVIMQPNNSTKSHKYVKIYPKVYKSMNSDQNRAEETAEPDATEPISNASKTGSDKDENNSIYTTVPTENAADIFSEEIPTTTLPTTSIPKVVVRALDLPELEGTESVLKNIDTAFVRIHHRRKRFVNDFPTVETDTDFIDKINHAILAIPKKDLSEKYPYYKTDSADIHEMSPLRYSEDLKNIPLKTDGNMAFYEQADGKLKCPEVETDIDPIPDRVKNAEKNAEEQEETTDIAELAGSPRLGKLGDKIDCFKLKYFGENPLDSPIFKEELIDPVKPIFKSSETNANNEIPKVQHYHNIVENIVLKNEEEKAEKEDLTTPESAESEEIVTIDQLDKENEIFSEDDEKYQSTPQEELNEILFKNVYSSKFIELPVNESTSEENDYDNEDLYKKQFQEEMIMSLYNSFTSTTTEQSAIDEAQIGINTFSDIVDNINATEQEGSKEENPAPVQSVTPTEASVISIITTPNYTIDLQPKHIYDQIELLEHLPSLNLSASNTNEEIMNSEEIDRQGKNLNDAYEDVSTEAPEKTMNTTEVLPETLALIQRRRRFRRKRPIYHIFDVNQYLPTTPFPLWINVPTTVLPKYKVLSEVFYKDEIKPNEQLNVFADVINNIKNSSGSMSPSMLDSISDSTADYSAPIAVKLNALSTKTKRMKVPPKKIRIKNSIQDTYLNAYDKLEEMEHLSSTTTSSTTTIRPIIAYRERNKNKSHKNNDQFYEELMISLQNKDNLGSADESQSYYTTEVGRRKRRKKPTTTTENSIVDKNAQDSIDYIEEPVTDVLGLVPPGQWQYKTIYNPMIHNKPPTSVYSVMEETEVNKFIVPGMKPPLENQNVHLYSDYKLLSSNQIKRRAAIPRRGKRSANRPSYSELSRNQGKQEEVLEKVPEIVADDDDDYVPHRPKNYHYDEKTGKIVYDTVKKEEPKEDEEEVEYVEVYEEKTTKRPPKTTENPFLHATRPPEGASYIDFVKKLKSDKTYHEIPDPTTTEKDQEVTTEKTATTTVKAEPTKPPEFLSILAKVRGDSNYKVIEDEKKTESTTSTTAAPDEEEAEVEEEEESQLENVQNSPGGQNYGTDALQIFDISDFLPKVKNYLPKTSVDTSKYKTIERPATRHNISSKYNDEEGVKNSKNITTEDGKSSKPELKPDTDIQMNPEASESKYESLEEVEISTKPIRSTTTVTTTTTTSTTEPPTTTTTEPSTTTKRARVRGRKRVTTTAQSVESTTTPSTTSTTTEREVVDHDKPRRNYRRRPTRIKIRTTTEKGFEEETDDTTKIIRRRSETETSIFNNDHTTTSVLPIVVDDKEDENENSSSVVDRSDVDVDLLETNEREGRIQIPEDKQNETVPIFLGTPGTIEPRRIESRKIDDVEVFNSYDIRKKHGGNYRKQQAEESNPSRQSVRNRGKQQPQDAVEIKPNAIQHKQVEPEIVFKQSSNEVTKNEDDGTQRLTDVVPKPFAFYSDPKLPNRVNQLVDDKIDTIIPNDDLEGIVGSVIDETTDSDVHHDHDEHVDRDNDFYDEVQINFGNSDQNPTTTKPVVIKDPSQRLYFYATL